MLTAETTTAYFKTIVDPEKIEEIVLSTKSFDIDSAKIAASYIERMKCLKIANLSDFIAGRLHQSYELSNNTVLCISCSYGTVQCMFV